MENASKALIMAGGILLALIVIGAFILMYNNLSAYQKIGVTDKKEAQTIEFNNQFTTYIRNDVRGSDMISLLNRIADYNTRKGANAEGFQEMEILVSGIDVNNLKYDTKNDEDFIKESYTQENISTLLKEATNLENTYQTKIIRTLATNINKIMTSEDQKAEIEKILKNSVDNYGGLKKVKTDIAKYYQYSQFKRVHFDCTESKYDDKSGRIIALKFKCNNKLN